MRVLRRVGRERGLHGVIYGIVLVVAVLARLVLESVPIEYVAAGQQSIWSWRFFAVFVVCYGTAVVVAARAGMPGPRETLARPQVALGLPAAVGIAVALLTVASDVLAPVAAARGVATVHVHGPAAVPFYAYGAIVLTTVFHFLPIAAVAWIARRLSGLHRALLVGVGILIVGFSEDTGFFLREGVALNLEWARHVLSVAANCAEALFIYRFGFLAGLAQRTSTYLVWHLVWPKLG